MDTKYICTIPNRESYNQKLSQNICENPKKQNPLIMNV